MENPAGGKRETTIKLPTRAGGREENCEGFSIRDLRRGSVRGGGTIAAAFCFIFDNAV